MFCRGCIKHNKITGANDDLIVLGSYAYDKFGNSVETIDVLCNTIFHTYDSFDNILSEWGTIYLVRYAYNTRNAADSVVNGRYDLVNLFAARLELRPFIDAWGSSVKFELSAYGEDTMRYCAVENQGRDPKKSGNLIAVLCCFCGWIDFGVLCGFGLGLRATGTLPLPVLRWNCGCKICSCIVNRDMQ